VQSARETPAAEAREGWKIAGVCLGLSLVVWLIYGQTLRQGFVNIDDDIYVYRNQLIAAGLTRAGAGWFLTHAYCDYWAPLLALSQMADCQLYGLWPGGHHLTNVLLFHASVLLLFAVLRQMTGALWRSAFVAAVWAVHPLRAESVAWITERKDMLCGLFFLLTLAAYVHYVRRPRSWWRYLAVPAFFALGLMAKPSLVMLPGLLLLLDDWPLGRAGTRTWAGWKPLVIEKTPLFALSAVSCVATLLSGSQTLVSMRQAPLAARAGNAVLSGVTYLRETFFPVGLAAYYPYPAHPAPAAQVALSLALLAAITTAAVAWRRTRPWLALGWFWYLVMLVPVLGLVQSGEQAHADRYTYLPQIGVLLAITWTAWRESALLRHRRWLLGAAAAVVLAALLPAARRQAAYWQDSETLWRHTLACTSANGFAQNNLGVALLDEGRRGEAETHFRAAIAIQPRAGKAQYNLGNLLFSQGRSGEAIAHYHEALAIDPDNFGALNNLGLALASKGRIEEAAAAYRQALVLRPGSGDVHDNLGHLLLENGRTAEAIGQFSLAVAAAPRDPNGYDGLGGAQMLANRPAQAAFSYQKALDLNPNDAAARGGLGSTLFLQGHLAQAVANWQEALALEPAKTSILNNLAWVLATGPDGLRDGAQAVRLAQLALRQTGGANPVVLRTLAAAYAEAGRFPEAQATAGEALKLALAGSNRGLAAEIRQEQLAYSAGSAFHEAPRARTKISTATRQPLAPP
jgi:Flp pilus assembly protein TadD